MSYAFPTEIQQLIDIQLATGKYESEKDVLIKALLTLADYDEAVADIQAGIADEAAGRVRPIQELAAARTNFGDSK